VSGAAGPAPGGTDFRRALAPLLDRLRARHGPGIRAVLLYGSCLRSGDVHDGLVDLYVLLDGYRGAGLPAWQAIANRLLPPNVYYLEAPDGGRTLRCKYATLTLAEFERRLGPGSFESYFWGRFCQPLAVVEARDAATAARLARLQERAAATLLGRALPLAPPAASVASLWELALAASYGTELRAEAGTRPAEVTAWGREHYARLIRRIAARLPFDFRLWEADSGLHYSAEVGARARRRARQAWRLRAGLGKTRALLRLVKAFFTFAGGLDYLAWKLERHSGQRVLIPDKVRRRPLLYGWAFFWRLYRGGLFK
jgi:hypothetical protein